MAITTATTQIEVRGALPAVEGELWSWRDGRYRLYTVDHVDFDALPAYGDGGPAKVVLDGWAMSTSSLSRALSSPSVVARDDGMHTLNIDRVVNERPGGGSADRHPLDGTRYATYRDADRAAYGAGIVGFMVYERDAAGFGLPTIATE
jgi:hypothetical protein